MDTGEVEGEAEGSDDPTDELRGTRMPRRDERSTRAAVGKAREASSRQRAG